LVVSTQHNQTFKIVAELQCFNLSQAPIQFISLFLISTAASKVAISLLSSCIVVLVRAVEPDPKRFWMMAGAGAKKFLVVEQEPEIWVLVPQT